MDSGLGDRELVPGASSSRGACESYSVEKRHCAQGKKPRARVCVYEMPRVSKSMETGKQIRGCQGLRVGGNGKCVVSLWGGENVLEPDSGDGLTTS